MDGKSVEGRCNLYPSYVVIGLRVYLLKLWSILFAFSSSMSNHLKKINSMFIFMSNLLYNAENAP